MGCLALPLGAAEDGGQAAAWTKLALGARSAALGQAVTALENDPDAVLLNPALAATQQQAHVGSQAAYLADGQQLHYLGFTRPFWPDSRFGWSLAYAQFVVSDPLERRRGNTSAPDSFFRESASQFQVGVGGWLVDQRVAVGLSLRVLSQALGDASSEGYSGDGGLYWRALPHLGFAVVLRDLANRLTWSSDLTESIPARLLLSADGALWNERLHLLAEADAASQQTTRPRLGVEVWAWPERLAFRGGYDGDQFSAGLGLHWPWRRFNAGLDYALLGDPGGGFQHRYSLQVSVPL